MAVWFNKPWLVFFLYRPLQLIIILSAYFYLCRKEPKCSKSEQFIFNVLYLSQIFWFEDMDFFI